MKTAAGPTLAEIQAARERVHGLARETPVISSETLGKRSGRKVFLKAIGCARTHYVDLLATREPARSTASATALRGPL